MAVGALCWQSRQLEPYSSQGPTIDGRIKPDIVGHDSVSSATYGTFNGGCPSAFAGTSASSPEVAGAAALVKQAYPKFGPDQIKELLMRSARDLGAPGLDSVYGAGELQLPKPPDIVAPTAKALVSTGRRGKMLKLLSTVSDDSGEVSVVEQVKLGGKTVATIKRGGFVSATSSRDRRDALEGAREGRRRLPALRPRDGSDRQCELAHLREARHQVANCGGSGWRLVAATRNGLERFLRARDQVMVVTTMRRPEGRRQEGDLR